jgi:hypothetical protein
MAGDSAAEPLLAAAVQGQRQRLNAAIVASGGQRSDWRTVRTRDGHWRAQRHTFHGDGRVTTATRWKYRSEGPWLTPREFGRRVEAARQRQRKLKRMIPAVGRPQRRQR